MVSPWLLHRHRKLWRDPNAFDPHRFRDGSSTEAMKCAFMPFGSGQRICIGAGFATQEALLILAEILRRYRIEALPNKVPEPVGRVTIRPLRGVHVRFEPRPDAPPCPADETPEMNDLPEETATESAVAARFVDHDSSSIHQLKKKLFVTFWVKHTAEF